MAVTSANLSGQSSAVTADEVTAQLGKSDCLLIDGGRCPGGFSSTVVDCTGEEPIIIREGPINAATIQAIWHQSRQTK
jgi:L-threonylcarbamoyladenylate synthase